MDLYELTGNLKWIENIIIKYNELGFYTVTSQPGTENFNRYQRAYIRGYMNIEMANFIIENINNPNIFIRSENHNKILDKKYCNCCFYYFFSYYFAVSFRSSLLELNINF